MQEKNTKNEILPCYTLIKNTTLLDNNKVKYNFCKKKKEIKFNFYNPSKKVQLLQQQKGIVVKRNTYTINQ